MFAILSVLLVLFASLLVTRVAAVALIETGLSREAARFQARSAFTGTGFTTSEAESVVNHPVRRRIVMALMLMGNAGIVTVIASLVIGFAGTEGGFVSSFTRLGVLAAGVAVLWSLATSRLVDRLLGRSIAWALKRWTAIDVGDYAEILHLAGDFAVRKVTVRRGTWLDGHALSELGLREEGLTLLGVERADGSYEGVPAGRTRIEAGDRLLLYGRRPILDRLQNRRPGAQGDREHGDAVSEQRRIRGDARSENEERPPA